MTEQIVPTQADEALTVQLETIARTIGHWLKWDSEKRARENLTTEADTYIMTLPVAVWPSHGMLRNWVSAIRAAATQPRIALSREEVARIMDPDALTAAIMHDFARMGGLPALMETANWFPRIRSTIWLRINEALAKADQIIAMGSASPAPPKQPGSQDA